MRNKLVFSVSLVACVLSSAALRVDAQTAACTDGFAQFHARNWQDAAMSLANCEASAPGRTDALLFRGKALINLGNFAEAAQSLEVYAAKHRRSDDALYTLGYVQFRQNQPRESLATLGRAAALKPPTSEDLKIGALDYVLLNDYKDAARYLEDALRLDPGNFDARYSLGRVRYQLNQFDQAIAAFDEVLRHDPANLKAEYNLGLSYEGKNQVADAISCYKKAIELERASSTRDEQPYLDYGALLSRSNRAAEAIPLLLHAVEIKPDSGKAQYELAKAYLGDGRAEDARAAGEKAIACQPEESSYHYLLGRIYAKLGKSDLASAEFKTTDALLKSRTTPNSAVHASETPR